MYSSAISVALGLDYPAEELGLKEGLTYLADPNFTREELGSGDPKISGIIVIAHIVRDKIMSFPEQGTLTLFMPSYLTDHENWGCEKDENGKLVSGDKYKQLKQECADILIKRAEEKLIPNLKKHVIYCDGATPITHQRYTGNKGGNNDGPKTWKRKLQS